MLFMSHWLAYTIGVITTLHYKYNENSEQKRIGIENSGRNGVGTGVWRRGGVKVGWKTGILVRKITKKKMPQGVLGALSIIIQVEHLYQHHYQNMITIFIPIDSVTQSVILLTILTSPLLLPL
jgi:hypothetical protein